MITFEEFRKMDIRVGKVKNAEKVKGTERLLKLEVDIGSEIRTLVAGIGDVYSAEKMVGKEIPILTNLKPKVIRGIESKGMILCVDVNGKPVLIRPERDVPPGSKII